MVQVGFSKRAAVRQFEQALLEEGLPPSAASLLAGEYADMISLNPLAYTRGLRILRSG